MDEPLEHHIRLPGEPGSPGQARRMVRALLREAGLDELADDALLLTSELCENAVLHAGTGFELAVTVTGDSITIGVTDHGSTAMELRRTEPGDRLATHFRGLQLVDTLATEWGSRHDGQGHQVWFTVGAKGSTAPAVTAAVAPHWPDAPVARWLLHLPAATSAGLPLPELVTELVRRLCDVTGASGGTVWVDGPGRLADYGYAGTGEAITVALPLSTPHRGWLRLHSVNAESSELAELTAGRIALAVESDRMRSADAERWSWMTYLSEAGELLGQSLDVRLTAAMVPQLVVPRLGRWCAVHLRSETGRLELAALTHVEESELPGLRAALRQMRPSLQRLLDSGGEAAGLEPPEDGVAVPLRLGQSALGTLSVGRLGASRAEEIMMISDLARRAALAIDNAQRHAAHVATSQALQQALLPRALPVADGVRFAAAYLPVSSDAEVGGDFYDVLPVGGDRWLVAVGDVCGKGARAAARTSLVRDVLRVLIRDGVPVTRAVGLLNELMLEAQDPSQFATVAVALLTANSVELVLAGHERPVLVRADGTAALVGRHGTAVGLVDAFEVHPTRHDLGPGDTLVFYTDGIIERRRGTEQFGQERLVSVIASAAGESPERLVTALREAVQEFAPEPRLDDIAIVVVRIVANQ